MEGGDGETWEELQEKLRTIAELKLVAKGGRGAVQGEKQGGDEEEDNDDIGFEEMGINAHLLRALARKTLKANASASEGYAVYSQREGRSGMGKDGHHVEGIIFVALGT
jgi:hypothetical protein